MSRTAVFIAAVAISLTATSAMAARSLDALQAPGPGEAAAAADVGFAASCRAAARELLGQGSFNFERPSYASRDGEAIVRMDVSVPGLGRDGLFRAVCVRDRRTGAVDAAIFDAPAEAVGPRVISLGGDGPPGGAKSSGDSVISFNYNGGIYDDLYYGGFYPGFWGSAFPFDGRGFDRRGFRDHRRHHRDALDLRGRSTAGARFFPSKPRSSGFTGSFRLGTGGFIR
jgi:hypothetical protein